MPRAKPAYDTDGSWKSRQFEPEEWEDLKHRLRIELRPFYPDKNAQEDPTFGHPADGWANALLSAADSGASKMLWLRRRLTNEQLRAERKDLLRTLEDTVNKLSTVSQDLNNLFGVDADVLGTRDKIKKLIPAIDGSASKIAALPRAKNLKDAQNAAAVEMAVRALHVIKGEGGKIAATADPDHDRASDAVSILKILGDALGLRLSEVTWKRVIAQARDASPSL